MNGEGFEYLVKKGQHVKEGQPILKFDKAKIEAKGLIQSSYLSKRMKVTRHLWHLRQESMSKQEKT